MTQRFALRAEQQGAKRQILTPCAEHHYVHRLVARRFARSHNTNNPTPDNSPIVAESIIIRSVYLPDDKPLSKLTKVSDLVNLFGLTAPKNSDIVAASRTGDFFDFDLASTPKTCSSDLESIQNFGSISICPYDKVHLVRATTSLIDGKTTVMELISSRDGWLTDNSEIRSVRRSMKLNQKT